MARRASKTWQKVPLHLARPGCWIVCARTCERAITASAPSRRISTGRGASIRITTSATDRTSRPEGPGWCAGRFARRWGSRQRRAQRPAHPPRRASQRHVERPPSQQRASGVGRARDRPRSAYQRPLCSHCRHPGPAVASAPTGRVAGSRGPYEAGPTAASADSTSRPRPC